MDKSLTLQAWINSLQQTFVDKFNTPILRHSVLSVLARVFGGASFELYQYLDVLAEQGMVDTATGEYLTRWASIWGIYRKEAQFATGSVLFQSEGSGLIAKGTQLKRDDGTLFKVTEGTDIAVSKMVPVKAIDHGSVANTAADVNLQLISPILGVVNQVMVVSPSIMGGQETETDDGLRARLLDRIQNPILGGRLQDYIQWAKEVNGVANAWVSACHFGVGTVAVTYLCDDEASLIPDESHLQLVQSHLESRRPLSAEVFVLAPQAVPINLNVKIEPNETDIQQSIISHLTIALQQQTHPGMTIHLSFYHKILSNLPELIDYELVLPGHAQIFQFHQLPALGEITWQSIL